MTAHINELPDESLHNIISYLGNSSLQAMSLVDKRCSEVSSAALFGHLDLGKRDADELEDFYLDLFQEDAPRLRDGHIKKVSVQLLEDLHSNEEGDESEFSARLHWVLKILGSLSSISKLELEITLADLHDEVSLKAADDDGKESPTSKLELQLALTAILSEISGKVDGIDLWVDSFATEIQGEDEDNNTSAKLNAVLENMPIDLVRALNLNGMPIRRSPVIEAIISSPRLEKLTLKECSGDFSGWKPDQLKSLVVSWGGSAPRKDLADLKLAVRLSELSQTTLEILVLQNISGVNYAEAVLDQRLKLSKVHTLQLADSNLEKGSLLNVLLSLAELPVLTTLQLETEDILSSQLAYVPNRLASLKQLRLSEGRVRSASPRGHALFGSPFSDTQRACTEAGINLAIDYSVLRCDDWHDLSGEIVRIGNLASNLDTLSLSVSSSAILGLTLVETVPLPELSKLTLGVSDFSHLQEDEDENPVEVESQKKSIGECSLADLIKVFDAPHVKELQITLFAEEDCRYLEDLKAILDSNTFPNLETLGGAVMASLTMPEDDFAMSEDMVRFLCRRRGIECSGFQFISRDDLLSEYYDSDEELDSADELELGTIEEVDEEDLEEGNSASDSDDSGMAGSHGGDSKGHSEISRIPTGRRTTAGASRSISRARAASTSSYGSWSTDDE